MNALCDAEPGISELKSRLYCLFRSAVSMTIAIDVSIKFRIIDRPGKPSASVRSGVQGSENKINTILRMKRLLTTKKDSKN